MPPLTLEGDTIGEKRRLFNKLVEDAIADENYKLRNISSDDSDVENLLKIEIASRNRNVDYIIEVLKSNDMLYAATAIKKSTWLITDPQYAHIINPVYLHTQLLPSMNTKTFHKLMLHIRHNLKDETRVETFYEYLKGSDSSYKWLQHCSIPYIENIIKNESDIPLYLFKRLCRRSVHFLTFHTHLKSSVYEVKKETLFLLKTHTADVLNILQEHQSSNPEMGRKKTEILMKTYPQKILDNFEIYCDKLDLSVVAKYMKKEEIKPFLVKEMKQNDYFYRQFENLRHFVKNMPEEEKLEFIKQTFIDRTDLSFFSSGGETQEQNVDVAFYYWYEYIPFDIAISEMKKHILAENRPVERFNMLEVLTTCACRNPQHIKRLLRFFFDRHINEPFMFKIRFVNDLLSKVLTHEFDAETWNILDKLFHSMEVYTESENDVQECLRSIILYKVLHDEPVPDIIEQKFSFHAFDDKRRTLNQEQSDKICTYLLNYLLNKMRSNNISNESDFCETIDHLDNALFLLDAWGKDISKYSIVLEKIQELLKIRQEKRWKTDMSRLYNVNKSWRKHMLEESLSLCLSEEECVIEEACLNALKHKPQLLTRHDKELDAFRTNDAISLQFLLAKLRVYWPDSLAQHWTDAYLLHLNKPSGKKAVIKGLFALLPQNQIIDIAKLHAPDHFKIKWGKADQTEVTIRKNIAKHLHVARPLIPLEVVLWYSKGDYLQHALPSLNAIMSKLSQVESRNHILKLLEAKVSLRKFGLHMVYSKLELSELKPLISNIWNSTKNSVIRTVIFKNTFRYLCNVKKATVEKELYTLLSSFIDKLPSKANKRILKCLGKAAKVPISVQADYIMKSYTYLTSAHDSAFRDSILSELVSNIRYNTTTVDSLDDDFVSNILLSPTKFCMNGSDFVGMFARYVLWGTSEEHQLKRFRNVVEPAMKEAFLSWHNKKIDEYFVITNFTDFIDELIRYFTEFTFSRRTAPAKLFKEIKITMEKNMDIKGNYVLFTKWKLVTEFAISMEQHISKMGNALWTGDDENIWNEIKVAIFPALGSRIVNCLKEDTKQYYPSICLLFTEAFNSMADRVFQYNVEFTQELLKHMLCDPDFIPSYIVVSGATNKSYDLKGSAKRIRSEIRKKIKSHPSIEVQLHYYNDFQKCPLDEV